MTLVYECDSCGACCGQGSIIIEADVVDAIREPKIVERCQPLNVDLPGINRMWHLAYLKECTFLEKKNENGERHCEIYKSRPDCCVCFQAGSVQCQDLRKQNGLEPLQPVEREKTLDDELKIGVREYEDASRNPPRPPTVHGREDGKPQVGGASILHNAARAVAGFTVKIGQAKAKTRAVEIEQRRRDGKKRRRKARKVKRTR